MTYVLSQAGSTASGPDDIHYEMLRQLPPAVIYCKLEEGQIVAAPFLYDNKWYRAEVAKVTLDDYNVEDSKVCLYYVDYGDSSTRYKHEVCELRTDFLRLRFQAIECCLARVKPRSLDHMNGIELVVYLNHTEGGVCDTCGWETGRLVRDK
uniref:Tudor domain-containing protein n=1 Tax=Timema tahoe TaxID=61484 RepID=A0A7R9NXT9_9NEOP|nr:unnamed protein product [Timema tahoe]